jgi:hypothetical protein
MGSWNVDGTSRPGVLCLRLEGALDAREMEAFVRAHDAAIDAFRGRDYRVFCDIRDLKPFSPDAAAQMEKAKAYSDSRRNFQGSAVLISSAVVGLQHHRTSMSGGVASTELISADEQACWDHLARVKRI